MKTSRVSIMRRAQIIEAAIAVIDEQGIQCLSLSEIEKKTGLARGQLMYYFRSKEDILLAVFDRLLEMMHAHAASGNGNGDACHVGGKGWEHLQHFLTLFLIHPPVMPAFHSLQYTFLSQISHREDFRARLANLYASWRVHMADDLTDDLAHHGRTAVSPRTFATLVQAILHGLAMQHAADPAAYDAHEMLHLVLNLLSSYVEPATGLRRNKRVASSLKPKASTGPRPRTARRDSAQPKKVNP